MRSFRVEVSRAAAVAVAVAAVLLAVACPAAAAGNVKVRMHASWPSCAASPFLEASEYIAAASPDKFWPFIDAAIDAVSTRSSAVEVAAPLLSRASLTVLNASVAMRAYSPAVELHRQLSLETAGVCGQGADAWALV